MLKLKYLSDNPELAKLLVGCWKHDVDSLDLFEYFRISSNAIYPFRVNGQIHLLRFAPIEEKDETQVAAELEFIDYLKVEGLNVLEAVTSRNRKHIERMETPWGTYLASVFKRVDGQQLGELSLTPEMCRLQGKTLAELHVASTKFVPVHNRRKSYEDCFDYMKMLLKNKQNESLALSELQLLRTAFVTLEKNVETFGLIHYDFELDNLFYDKGQQKLSIIDFDDAMYHWYAQDVHLAIKSIQEEYEGPETHSMENAFLEGYSSIRALPAEFVTHHELFDRFAYLYGYCRILNATDEKFNDEPGWMIQLRARLERLKAKRSVYFGRELVE